MQGILFQEPLYPDVVDGTKTQTRRAAKYRKSGMIFYENDKPISTDIQARYKVGEVVYLKEPYCIYNLTSDSINDAKRVGYQYYPSCPEVYADMCFIGRKSETVYQPYYHNKLFMGLQYAREFIKITAVRAEWLQHISDEDCKREGIKENYDFSSHRFYWGTYSKGITELYSTPKEAYAALIDQINGFGTWKKNPLVWVYDFIPVFNLMLPNDNSDFVKPIALIEHPLNYYPKVIAYAK